VISQRQSATEIRLQLRALITQANTVKPSLAVRLSNLLRWIKSKTDRQITQKTSIVDFLSEIILDANFWLVLQTLTPEQKQQFYIDMKISPAEQYWFGVLFPLWFDEPDPKLDIWKKELMAGNFSGDDMRIIRAVSLEIKKLGGSCLWKYPLDLSMATDLLAMGLTSNALLVQITTLAQQYLSKKKSAWEDTLKHWKIKRGLLISYNPMPTNNVVQRISGTILRHIDSLPSNCYTLDKA
jgi:hypothetical protein